MPDFSALAAETPTKPPPIAEEEEYYSSWSLFLVCMLLILSLWTSYYLQIKRIRALHETLVSIFAGMAVGLIVRLSQASVIREMLTFKHTLFFNLLLPPIILASGYELKQENFFRNFGSILTFAFLGTFISAVGVGMIVYVYSLLGLESVELPLLDCLIFGSTLSATDPVTILAIFNTYKVDPKLYSIIFGESLLNDAVSIVMYETLTKFHGEEVYLSSIFKGVGIFLLSFSSSMALGVAFGLSMSLLLKHSSLNAFPSIESCLVALSAYTCYFFSNGIGMSGIVSLLFCGITLKHYAYHTMSRRTQRASKYLFQTLAQLSENFIFIYLGMALFTSAPTSGKVTSYVKPLFITITTVAVIFTRYAAVFPLSEAINLFHKYVRGQRQEELPHSYQMMLFWAGLRGAVGVALAAGFKSENAQLLRTSVLVVVVATVLLFGGTTARMLEVLGIRTGVEDDADISSDEEDLPFGRDPWRTDGRRGAGAGGRWSRFDEDAHLPNSANSLARGAGRIGAHYSPRMYNHHQRHHQRPAPAPLATTNFSSDSDTDSAEVLPLAHTSPTYAPGSTTTPNMGGPSSAQASPDPGVVGGEDGKWFQTLDERYFLPLFSNATASRTFHARRARRSTAAAGGAGSAPNSAVGTPVESDDEGSGREMELGLVHGGHGDPDRAERGLPRQIVRSSSSSSVSIDKPRA